jgi:hypothetical protein
MDGKGKLFAIHSKIIEENIMRWEKVQENRANGFRRNPFRRNPFCPALRKGDFLDQLQKFICKYNLIYRHLFYIILSKTDFGEIHFGEIRFALPWGRVIFQYPLQKFIYKYVLNCKQLFHNNLSKPDFGEIHFGEIRFTFRPTCIEYIPLPFYTPIPLTPPPPQISFP